MKMLDFYKVYSWMLAEFGAGDPALIAYAFLYSYYENGKKCKVSLTSIANVLQCSRRQAIRIIMRLDYDGYIHIERDGRKTNIYEISVEKAVEMQQNFFASDTDDTSTSDMYDTSTSDTDVTRLVTRMSLASDMYDTSTSDTDVTLIENKREIKREGRESVCVQDANEQPETESTPTPTLFDFRGKYPHVKIPVEQYARLRTYAGMKGDKTLDYYLTLLENQIVNQRKTYQDHALRVRSWMEQDGGTENSTSLDMQLYEDGYETDDYWQ